MRINVLDLKLEMGRNKTVPVQVTLESVDDAGEMVDFPKPFTGKAEIWNLDNRLLVKAQVSGEAIVSCTRCLTRFDLPLKVKFEEEFVEGTPDEADDEDESLEERTVCYYTGDEIDLADSLRENVLLELPMQAICKESCEGLCPSCGQNRNEGPCQCGTEDKPVDPRFAMLKELLRKPDAKS